MPRIERNAEVTWEGNLARGNGTITAATGAFEQLPYSLATRVGAAEGKTSPEELLAAAHAGCYSMSLAGELTTAGPPTRLLTVTATVVMDEVVGKGHQIVGSNIVARGRVPGVDADAFRAFADAADASCPFSALIKATGTVTVDADLLDA
ncbi:MAG: OsmC family peroxiredoxin [Gaiellaceae bacterium]